MDLSIRERGLLLDVEGNPQRRLADATRASERGSVCLARKGPASRERDDFRSMERKEKRGSPVEKLPLHTVS